MITISTKKTQLPKKKTRSQKSALYMKGRYKYLYATMQLVHIIIIDETPRPHRNNRYKRLNVSISMNDRRTKPPRGCSSEVNSHTDYTNAYRPALYCLESIAHYKTAGSKQSILLLHSNNYSFFFDNNDTFIMIYPHFFFVLFFLETPINE